jgi:hypothetical protein
MPKRKSPTDDEWAAALERAKEKKRKHERLFRRLSQEAG